MIDILNEVHIDIYATYGCSISNGVTGLCIDRGRTSTIGLNTSKKKDPSYLARFFYRFEID
ncbi:MAG TPA: hypothetical protein DHV68_08165 [Dehalococcoidia bacterium]|nr:hypothetical protein [Dehalococcoidia bacterium]